MRILAASLLCLAVTFPAHAADLATIDCVVDRLDPAARTQLEADVARNLEETGKHPTYDAGVSKGLSDAAVACTVEHKWKPAAAKAALNYALAKAGLPTAQRVIGEKGFDPAALEDAFQALPIETRNAPLSAEQIQELVIATVTDEAQQTRANAELLNEYFLFLSTLQYAAHDFSEA